VSVRETTNFGIPLNFTAIGSSPRCGQNPAKMS